MYFSNNYDSYMQDLYFYNQNPNTYMNNIPMPNFMYSNQTMNISNYYPSLYKILIPVIIRVIQNSNYQYLNEEIINNMTESVFNIVEGDLVKEDKNENVNNQSNSSNNINNNSNNFQVRENSKKTNENALLQDIIKILVIKELQNRQIRQINQNMMYNQFQI